MPAQHLHERHRGARAGVEDNAPYGLDRLPREQGDGGNWTARSDAHLRHQSVVGRLQIFDGRNETQIDFVRMQQRRTDGGHVVPHLPQLRRTVECPCQRAGVQVPDRSNADPSVHEITWKRPSRSTGENPAASIPRRTSSSGARRRPSGASSDAVTPSTSSAPKVSATCASFGPYRSQSTWTLAMFGAASRAIATAFTSS